jgi:branched-chain amino acid transport system substrate-binding protein
MQEEHLSRRHTPIFVALASLLSSWLAIPGTASAQQPALARGIASDEIRLGMAAPFTGPARELGQQMRVGVEAAFRTENDDGGINGRMLRLVTADDGYEPSRTPDAMKQLYDRDQVFGFVGNVGTPTAAVAAPFALERRALFFGAFTGAGLLRRDPPDRYVFNYRASYAEETAAAVRYLIKMRKLKPEQIAVFAQQDAYGDSGYSGVEKAMRAFHPAAGPDTGPVLRAGYQRNTIDVDNAVSQIRTNRYPIKAVVMVATYRAAAKFIEKMRPGYPNMIFTNVSFVGSSSLRDELMLLGPKYAQGVLITQTVPPLDGKDPLVLQYRAALAKFFRGEAPDYVSLEGFVAAQVLIEALRRVGPAVDTEKTVAALENMHGVEIGLGTPINFSRSEHQGCHKVWATQLTETGRFDPVNLQ